MEPVKSRNAKRRARLRRTAILKSKILTQDFLAHFYYPSGWWPHEGAEDGYCLSKSADLDVILASLEPDQAENGTTVVSAEERVPAMDQVQNDEEAVMLQLVMCYQQTSRCVPQWTGIHSRLGRLTCMGMRL